MVFKENTGSAKEQVLNLENVNKNICGKSILKNINVKIYKNTIHAFIGPNGAGKTTLVRVILNLFEISSGKKSCDFNNEDISVLLENDYLFESKTGRENIEHFCLYFKIDRDNVAERLDKYSKLLGIDSRLDEYVSYYSKGMKRKLSILIVILRNSDFLIFDEMTSGVDPESRVQIRKILKSLKEEGKTILIISHDLQELEKVADRISIVVNGQIKDTIENNELLNLEDKFFQAIKGEQE